MWCIDLRFFASWRWLKVAFEGAVHAYHRPCGGSRCIVCIGRVFSLPHQPSLFDTNSTSAIEVDRFARERHLCGFSNSAASLNGFVRAFGGDRHSAGETACSRACPLALIAFWMALIFNDAFGQRQFAQDWPSATALGRLNEIVTAGNCA